MAKGTRGGKRAAASVGGGGGGIGGSVSPSANAPQDDVQDDVKSVTPAATMSADYNKFASMTDDQKADAISKTIQQGVPAHLADNDFQRFIYNIGLNDKPDVVSDATLSKMSGTDIYRTVNSVYDRRNDISYTADQIAKQVIGGRVTRVSDSGGSLYGRGIYFADNRSSSTAYGSYRGNVKKTAVIHGKLNANARIITHSAAQRGAQAEIQRGTKLGRVLGRCDYDSQSSIYAMSKGYNVMSSGSGWNSGYYTILSRSAVTMSDAIKPI